MKARELAAVLRELEKHPRITSIAIGDLRVTFGEPTVLQAAASEQKAEPGTLELPTGVYDPRERIDAIYAKARAKARPATDETS
jgi:hypothetical protein